MALSSVSDPVKAYYNAITQIEKDLADLTNTEKYSEPNKQALFEQALFDRVFTPTIALGRLYAEAAQGLQKRDLEKLTKRHNDLMSKLHLPPVEMPAPASRPPEKSSSLPQKTSSASLIQKPSSITSTSSTDSKSTMTLAHQLMDMLEETEDRSPQEIRNIFSALSTTSRYRAFKMLYRLHGCTGDIVSDGAACLARNPKSLLTRVLYHGKTMRIIDHLIVKSNGILLCDDVASSVPDWQIGVKLRTKEEICESLDAYLAKSWHHNFKETGRTEEELLKAKQELRKFNQEIFKRVQLQTGVRTPMELSSALQGYGDNAPRKIGQPLLFVPEKGQFYKLDEYAIRNGQPPLKIPGPDGDAVNDKEHWGEAVKRTGNHLYLFQDPYYDKQLFINGEKYRNLESDRRRGCTEPAYRFKEGDVVCSHGNSYLFTVGKFGTIHYAGKEKANYPTSKEALDQSQKFGTTLALNHEEDPDAFRYTLKPRAAEIEEPLLPGFYFPSNLRPQPKAAFEQVMHDDFKQRGDLVFVDVPNDPVLKSLIAYLEKEFEVMQYTEAQKMMRIALLSADLLSNNVESYKFKENNYQLGEIVRAGAGNAHHRSALNKVLCDALKVPCTCIYGCVDVEQPTNLIVGSSVVSTVMTQRNAGFYAWNVMQVEGRKYLVDSFMQSVFPFDNPPGTTEEARQKLRKYYAVKG